MAFELSVLPEELAVCRLPGGGGLPDWLGVGGLASVTWTPDETSVVCPAALVPFGILAEKGWRALKVAGPLDFSLTGALVSLAEPLSAVGISIFSISTYDTDYLLVKSERLAEAIDSLEQAGHVVRLNVDEPRQV